MNTTDKLLLNHLGRQRTSLSETLFTLQMGLDLAKAEDKNFYDLVIETHKTLSEKLRLLYNAAEARYTMTESQK